MKDLESYKQHNHEYETETGGLEFSKNLVKKFIPIIPKKIRFLLLGIYEEFYAKNVKKYYKYENNCKSKQTKNILFYHRSALSSGGTEKFLQIIAKYISKDKYKIYYMYGDTEIGRKSYLENQNITLIPFSFVAKQESYPYIIEGMSPSIYDVIKDNNIDLLITAGSGYSEFPFNIIKDIPILMLNIFGSPSAQKNIVKHFCISHEVANKVRKYLPTERLEVTYIPSEEPKIDKTKAENIRPRFNIKDTDMVFGRIGRASDEIFDPIGIRSFQRVVQEFPHAHYVIMSSPPILQKIVKEENIPNVHFLESSSDESDVWAFHGAIDVLAHFRNDGESCGLNIIESLLCGNPVITHKSHIWNAHLEYLQPEWSRVAERGDIDQYTNYMKEFILLKETGQLENLGNKAREQARKLFLIDNVITKIESTISKIKHD